MRQGILAQDLGFVLGAFQRLLGGFRGREGEGAISTICRGPAGVLEADRGTPVPSFEKMGQYDNVRDEGVADKIMKTGKGDSRG